VGVNKVSINDNYRKPKGRQKQQSGYKAEKSLRMIIRKAHFAQRVERGKGRESKTERGRDKKRREMEGERERE
jgi:hypothetical protein